MAVTLAGYTTETIDGTGVFDGMMRAAKAHLVEEFQKGRITGVEYSTVYLGMLNAVMDKALALLLEKEKSALELAILQAELDKLLAEKLLVEAQILLTDAQKCKADAEFDLIMAQVPKVAAEISLLTQKVVTETAQTNGAGVSPDSVIGKQLVLYANQAEGFLRDAEQKILKLLADTWNVRRTTDDTGTQADVNNGLYDPNILRAVDKALAGINA